ncbi:SNF2 domain-containing protein CLASSY 4-like [Silene latifolia]|uniref:SNF2 domain-containing protein CLASSY 4-like n=1 Tax=Silene latifolia TaxID=37657 RepID=UPI003D778438
MEPMPIGKRTRLQRAIQEREIRERSRRARLEARMKYRKEIDLVISDDEDGEAVQIVGEEELDKMPLNDHDKCSNDVLPNVDVNVMGDQFYQFGINNANNVDNGDCRPGCSNVNDEDSDDSLQILGVKYNPLMFGVYDDIDDDSDDEDDIFIDGCVPSTDEVCVSKDGEVGQTSSDVGLTSSEDDNNDKDKDFKVDGAGNYTTSDYSTTSSDESDETSSDDEDYGVVRVREHKKRSQAVGGDQLGAREKSKERRRRRKERACEDVRADGVANGNVNSKSKKKKEKMTREETLENIILSINPETDAQEGDVKKKSNLESRSSVKIKKGSDGVFRKVVAASSRDEDDNVGGKTKTNDSNSNHSVKLKKRNEDGDVGGKMSVNNSNPNHPVRIKKGSDGVFRKVVSSSNDEDNNEDGNMHTHKSNRNAKAKKKPVDVLRKDGSISDEDEEPKKKTVRKDRMDEEIKEAEAEERSSVREKARSLSKRKRKEKALEMQNTLLDTIMEEAEEVVEETLPTPTPREHTYLPLKFHFPAKEAEPEKSEEELEFDNLFKELEFALQACHVGSESSVQSDKMDVDRGSSMASENRLCAGGNHHLIHDEEIGIYCRFCSYVGLESKHVLPDFASNGEIFGRAGRRDNKLQSDDKTGDILEKLSENQNDRENSAISKITQGTVWELIPETWKTLYPHQREGFEFIWKNVAGGFKIEELERPSKYGVGGCIICHAPGTGKTRLAIVFIQSFMKQYPMSRPVIVAPRTMLRTWQEEFVRWKVDVTFFNLNEDDLTGKEDFELLNNAAACRDRKTIRLAKLVSWVNGKGILGISYGLYEKLANERNNTNNTDKKVREFLLHRPGLMVLDEGHTPRNDKSNIWKALSDVLTKRKVILSGTPFQNNFEELSNTLSLVREEFQVPIKPGSYVQNERNIEELSNKIRPFVHVHKGEILKQTLQGLYASLIVLHPSKLQLQCFDAVAGQTNFALDNQVSVASVHPSIFCELKPDFVDKELNALLEQHKNDLDAGVKTRFLFELIKLCPGERVLVFGQFLPPLNFLAGLLKSLLNWEMGRELLYMDGHQDTKERQNTIKYFNDMKTDARVLLASTKACCEGIHLVGASRVVLLDVVWNPSVERQAISRAYRLGQKKDVFVYHLITSGTLEERKYQRQANKERLSDLVFSTSEGGCVKKASSGSHFFKDPVLEAMLDHDKLKKMFKKIVYQPKADNLIESFGPLNL